MPLNTARQDSQRDSTTARPRIMEIEGLRGIALSLVVLFHLFGNGRVSGGVDVFLVISAFLLSRSILRKAVRPEGARLVDHFSGLAARLVPSDAFVLTFVIEVTFLLLPSTSHRQNFQEVLASALYFENWELISSQLAYGAAGPDASPLQHFWSLSVQGQFFIAWPIIIIGVVWVARRVRVSAACLSFALAGMMTVFSAGYAFWLTSVDQPVAYLSTFARFWELGIGVLLGIVLPMIKIPDALRAVLAWIGLGLITTCGFFVDGGQLFPGPWTLWPVIGTVLVILGAGASSPPGPALVLDHPALRFFARISYPLYLWHWPLLVFYLQIRDQQTIGWRGAALVFAVSVFLSWLTVLAVEMPVARLRTRFSGLRLLTLPLAVTVVISCAAGGPVAVLNAERGAQLEAASKPSKDHVGALALSDGAQVLSEKPFVPAAEAADADLPALYEVGCVQNWRDDLANTDVLICESDVRRPSRTIVMSGGSHTLHWYPALAAVAAQENWAIVVVDKDGCRLADPSPALSEEGNESCRIWNERAIPTIIGLAPDAVFTVGTLTAGDGAGDERVLPAQLATWDDFTTAGIPVIAVRDTPRFTFDVPECVAENIDDLSRCGAERNTTLSKESPLASVELPDSVVEVDLTEGFCTPARCDPIVGNVLAYRDDDHMTATYSRTLAPALREALKREADWLF